MRFGERLNTERKKQKLSAETLAGACQVSRSYITLIENNKRLPGVKVLPRIADALGLKVSVILNWYLEDTRERLEETLGA